MGCVLRSIGPAVLAALVAAQTTDPPRWVPPPSATWQIQFTGPLDLSVNASIYDLDLFDTPAETVAALKKSGRRVICYLSAGSYENWRPDAARFPAAVLGRRLDGWPGERWLDIRRLEDLAPIMEARLDLCRAKGFDGADPDNMDGYTNNTGFPLSAEDQLRYNRWLARAAHTRGLAIGLKNDVDQVQALVSDFDWALNEQCFQYDECGLLMPFVMARKPVFVIEYELTTTQFCPAAVTSGFSAMRKNLSLDAFREACPLPRPQPPTNLRIIR
jgi:hypothetical protein